MYPASPGQKAAWLVLKAPERAGALFVHLPAAPLQPPPETPRVPLPPACPRGSPALAAPPPPARRLPPRSPPGGAGRESESESRASSLSGWPGLLGRDVAMASEAPAEAFSCILNENIPASESWVMVPERISWEIQKCQEMCKALEADRLCLEKGRQESEWEASRQQAAAALLREQLQQEEAWAGVFQEQPELGSEERSQLLQQKAALESELQQLERLQIRQVPPAPPERFVVFKGHTEEKVEKQLLDTLSVKPQIHYPLPGGTALVTFETPKVAQRVIALQGHRVQLDEGTFVRVKAEPVELLMPVSVEVVLEQSPRQVVLSGLQFPSLPKERLPDKLALFFSKRQHLGGEVEDVQWLSGPGHVLLTFVEDEVAERLIQRGQFQVTIGKETSTVKVSPYLDGKISDLMLHPVVCPRTVLLSGIPEVLNEELMREALEIHFQKPSKGGGEVEAVAYVPPGQCAVAVFEREEGGTVHLSSAKKLS